MERKSVTFAKIPEYLGEDNKLISFFAQKESTSACACLTCLQFINKVKNIPQEQISELCKKSFEKYLCLTTINHETLDSITVKAERTLIILLRWNYKLLTSKETKKILKDFYSIPQNNSLEKVNTFFSFNVAEKCIELLNTKTIDHEAIHHYLTTRTRKRSDAL